MISGIESAHESSYWFPMTVCTKFQVLFPKLIPDPKLCKAVTLILLKTLLQLKEIEWILYFHRAHNLLRYYP